MPKRLDEIERRLSIVEQRQDAELEALRRAAIRIETGEDASHYDKTFSDAFLSEEPEKLPTEEPPEAVLRIEMKFTPRAKKVLELAAQQAVEYGASGIGTEHILLGLIDEGEGIAAGVLHTFNAKKIRRAVEFIIGEDTP